MTKEQAKLIMEASGIMDTLRNDEEMELLEDNNPELAEAYYAFHRFGYGIGAGVVVNKFKRKE